MPLISRNIPALFNGISQQPATLRLPSQAEAQINAYGTVVDGLRKRPPSEHVATISTTALSGAHIHTINRDVTERFVVVVTDGDIKVYDINGVLKTLTFSTPTAQAYLDVGQADVSQSFTLVTIADYTFVVNKTKVIGTKAAPTTVPPEITATPPQHFVPDNWLFSDLVNPLIREAYFNQLQTGLIDTKQTFSDLPKASDTPPPAEGDVFKVAGFDQDSFGAYYVIRKGGVWEETHEPGSETEGALDEKTMPHALIRKADGTFSFEPFAWNVRKVGDAKSNPGPTFIGRKLSDVFYYKNRLGFLSDENVVFSGAGDFGNFWRNTVTDLLDSDVVDVAVSSSKVSVLRYGVPFNNNLMLFADQTQFALNVDQLLTPSSVSIDTVTEYEMSLKARPVSIGRDVYFVTQSGSHSRIREYFVSDGNNSATDATDITAHVPRFLPKNIIKLTGNANEDVLFALSSDEANRVYVYKFFWNENGKAQSSWSFWEIPTTDTILSIETLDNVLFLLIERAEGVFLEKIDIQSGATTGDLNETVLLDRQAKITTGVFTSGNNTTTFTLPYKVEAANQSTFKFVRGSQFTGQVLSLIDPTQITFTSENTISVVGDHTNGTTAPSGDVWIGQNYTKSYEFSEQFFMNGDRAVTTGRLLLRKFTIYYTDTAFFSTKVAPYGNDPQTEAIVPSALSDFTGKTLGAASLLIGEPVFATDRYSFQIYGDSRVAKVTLLNDTHVQSIFQSAEVEAFWHNRARIV